MSGDLDRVLADIDSLLPPGAPSTPGYDDEAEYEDWHDEAMRWQPVDHDDHPEVVRQSPVLASTGHPQQTAQAFLPARGEFDPPRPLPADYEVRATTPNDHHHVYWPAVWWIGPALRATEYAAALDNLTREAQRTTTNLQHLRDRWDRHAQTFAVIEARRNRNTGPTDPRGIDGRARRHQHPTRSAARNASPATHGTATPVLVAWLDGAAADHLSHWSGLDPEWRWRLVLDT